MVSLKGLTVKEVVFESDDYKSKVESEMGSGREINALFLVHGYIESYLREWLFIGGEIKKEELKQKVINSIERLSFQNLYINHVMLGNIDIKLYDELEQIKEIRNLFAHELVKIDFNTKKSKNTIKEKVTFAVDVCEEIVKLYKKALIKRQEKIK